MEKTTEQKTAESILQLPEKIKVGGREYAVAKPSTATLIMASVYISRLPKFELKKETMVIDVLRDAKDADGVGDVIAVMMVGAKGMNSWFLPRRWWKQWRMKVMKRIVLEDIGPAELQQLAYMLFSKMQVADFFALIAFLSEVNMTKPTKATTTASGQQ